MHRWGDVGVDWEGIGDATEFIADILSEHDKQWVSQFKEKWGMACVYCRGPNDEKEIRIYRGAYRKAIAQWPHLKEEILEGADWEEYLEGL